MCGKFLKQYLSKKTKYVFSNDQIFTQICSRANLSPSGHLHFGTVLQMDCKLMFHPVPIVKYLILMVYIEPCIDGLRSVIDIKIQLVPIVQ